MSTRFSDSILMLLLLITCVLAGHGRYKVIAALNADPNIDLIEIEEFQTLPNICNGKECPKYSDVTDARLPSGVKMRKYPGMNWISSSRYQPVDNSCLEGSEEFVRYYQELYNYFKGVNTMGLLMERTVPIRAIGQIDADTGSVLYCHLMFYIPEMYSVNAPAPLSVGIFVGHNWEKNCYVVSINGNYTWKRAMKIHKALKNFLARKNVKGVVETEMILDIYSGYGVPNPKKYSELLLCMKVDEFY